MFLLNIGWIMYFPQRTLSVKVLLKDLFLSKWTPNTTRSSTYNVTMYKKCDSTVVDNFLAQYYSLLFLFNETLSKKLLKQTKFNVNEIMFYRLILFWKTLLVDSHDCFKRLQENYYWMKNILSLILLLIRLCIEVCFS